MSNYVALYKHLFIQNSSAGWTSHVATMSIMWLHHTSHTAICQQDLSLSGVLLQSKDNGKVGLSVILVQVIEEQKLFEAPQKDSGGPEE